MNKKDKYMTGSLIVLIILLIALEVPRLSLNMFMAINALSYIIFGYLYPDMWLRIAGSAIAFKLLDDYMIWRGNKLAYEFHSNWNIVAFNMLNYSLGNIILNL